MKTESWDAAMMLVGVEGATAPGMNRLGPLTERHFGLEPGTLLSQSRAQKLVRARHMMRAFIKSRWDLTLRETGERTGGVNHATVLHSLEVHEDLMGVDRVYRREYEAYCAKCKEAGI